MEITAEISFDSQSSSILISTLEASFDDNQEIFENISRYLNLASYSKLKNDKIVIQVRDITSLGHTVSEIEKILEYMSLRVILDKNLEAALLDAHQAEESFNKFSEEARRIRNAESVLEEVPEFLKTVSNKMARRPFKKQLLAAFHITYAKNVANFSVPGTGKTTMVYTAFSVMSSDTYPNGIINSIIVIGPLSCFVPWVEEFEQCFGRKPNYCVIETEKDIDFLINTNSPVELILINYEKMRPGSLFQSGLISYCREKPTMLVLDEAHRVKNPEGVYANSIIPLSRNTKSRVVLTGTPIPQGFQDLINITRFLYPDKKIIKYSYQNLVKFSKKPNQYIREIEKLNAQFEPFFIRLSKRDFDLKPAIDLKPITLEFSSIEKRIFKTVEEIGKQSRNKFSIIRLLQASSNPFLLSQKLNLGEFFGEENDILTEESNIEEDSSDGLKEIREIIDNNSEKIGTKIKECASVTEKLVKSGEKVIIWVVFSDTAFRIHQALHSKGIKSGALLGKSNHIAKQINNGIDRDDVINKFKNSKELDCVIANAAAVGESISLHKNYKGEKVCSNAIYLERNFNCAQYLQSRDRIHRVGMAKNIEVKYHFLNIPGTIDNHLDNSLRRKAKVMEDFIENDTIPLIQLEDSDVMNEVYNSFYGIT